MAINNFNVGVGTTSQLTRYRYVATGGETSISGTDADSKTLSYTVGLEQVFLNGVNLVRGQDYTATDGTSVGALTALVASDVVEVFAYVPFNIANALTVSTVDAKGDLLVGTGADAVGRLAVGTDGQLLSAASGETSGLKWANPGLTLIKTETFTGVSSVSIGSDAAPLFSSTYDNYFYTIVLGAGATGGINVLARLRANVTDASGSNYVQNEIYNTASTPLAASSTTTSFKIGYGGNVGSVIQGYIYSPFLSARTFHISDTFSDSTTPTLIQGRLGGEHNLANSYNGLTILSSTGNFNNGTITIYGVAK